MDIDPSRRRTLKSAGLFGGGAILGGLTGAYGMIQYYSSENSPNRDFGHAPPELDTQIRGTDGPIVAFYTDFSCPHCHDFEAEVLPNLEDMVSAGEMRLLPRDWPIPVDETWSWRMPNVPRSAQAQRGSVDAYWEARNYIIENWNGGSFSEEYVRDLAAELDLDPDLTWEVTREQWYLPYVELDRELGEEDGVNGTPSVVVDGELLDGNSEEAIREAVRNAE